MAVDWSVAYEAPISLDAGRLIGTRARRPTLWTLAAVGIAIPVLAAFVMLLIPSINAYVPQWIVDADPWTLPPLGLWIVICYALGTSWGNRPAEYRLSREWRYRRLPRKMDDKAVARHHATYSLRETNVPIAEHVIDAENFPRAVIEVQTISLTMRDAESLSNAIKKMHMFLLGLRFPIRIVVRATQNVGYVDRRHFIAVEAETDELLGERVKELIHALSRAGLGGRALNGDLFRSLQYCWGVRSHTTTLGPSSLDRDRRHVTVDRQEVVRGFAMAKYPRTIEPNWLSGILDGELAVDFSMYLDPIDNATELDVLSGRISEWETAQVLNVSKSGFRDPDIDDQIKDAARTRLYLRQRKLRVFSGAVHFVVRGATVKEAEDRERLLMTTLREHVGDQALIPLDTEHDYAPILATPLGQPPAMYPLQLVSPAVAMGHPFSNTSIRMKDGVEVGTSLGSKRQNTLNTWLLDNPHMVVPGTTGSGKGFWLKVFVWRLLHLHPGWRVWIIQSEKDEYRSLVDAMPSSPRSHPKREALYSHEVESADEFSLLMNAQEAHHWQALRGETIQILSLDEFDDKVFQKTYGGKLTPRLLGQQLTLYDLTRMPEQDRGKGIARLIKAIDNDAQHDTQQTLGYVALDELGIVLKDKEAADAIEVAYRRFRSIPHLDNPKVVSRRGMIGLTQLPSDLLGNTNGKVYASLSETHLYLRQQPAELRVTKGPLNLTPDEVEFLETCDNGDALLVAGRSRVALHLYAEPEEEAFAVT